jgi:hypothetical protein
MFVCPLTIIYPTDGFWLNLVEKTRHWMLPNLYIFETLTIKNVGCQNYYVGGEH